VGADLPHPPRVLTQEADRAADRQLARRSQRDHLPDARRPPAGAAPPQVRPQERGPRLVPTLVRPAGTNQPHQWKGDPGDDRSASPPPSRPLVDGWCNRAAPQEGRSLVTFPGEATRMLIVANQESGGDQLCHGREPALNHDKSLENFRNNGNQRSRTALP
jgi:hypothetical protein